MKTKGENLDKVLMGILEEEGILQKTIEDIIETHGEISEGDLIKEIREKAITIGINKCADLGLIEIRMDNDGQAIISKGDVIIPEIKEYNLQMQEEDMMYPTRYPYCQELDAKVSTHKIKELEAEFERIENGGFPIPYEAFDNIPELTLKSKKIIMKFANFLSEKRIKLEHCSQWEYGFLFSLFKHKENNFKLTKKQRQKLQDIINRCQECMI